MNLSKDNNNNNKNNAIKIPVNNCCHASQKGHYPKILWQIDYHSSSMIFTGIFLFDGCISCHG